jgi:hypothetical protein
MSEVAGTSLSPLVGENEVKASGGGRVDVVVLVADVVRVERVREWDCPVAPARCDTRATAPPATTSTPATSDHLIS